MNAKSESNEATSGKSKVPWLLLITGVAAAALVALITLPDASMTHPKNADILVYKTPTCSCCEKWVAHVRNAGLKVDVVNVDSTKFIQTRVGVPRKLGSCHTAVAGDYWIEGHVPVDLIQKLIAERPQDIRGIAVPGMVAGSPGMEGPNPVVYDILAYGDDGSTTVYATRQGQAH